tara:strand:- start:102 stop:503 length:402 start_codon:yes stop_codon:yes gene_type:complete
MQNLKTQKGVLIGSGLIAIAVGWGLLFSPEAFHALNGIELGDSASLMSEIRAPGAGLLASGLLIFSGVFVSRLSFTALVVAMLLYLSYGISRFYSMALDGLPADGIIFVAFLEMAIGLACAFTLQRHLRTHSY